MSRAIPGLVLAKVAWVLKAISHSPLVGTWIVTSAVVPGATTDGRNRVREDARRHRHADLGRLGRPVANPCSDWSCPGWPGWLAQCTRSDQDQQREAEGDEPQHRLILACR